MYHVVAGCPGPDFVWLGSCQTQCINDELGELYQFDDTDIYCMQMLILSGILVMLHSGTPLYVVSILLHIKFFRFNYFHNPTGGKNTMLFNQSCVLVDKTSSY